MRKEEITIIYNVSDIGLFKRGDNLCVAMTIQVHYDSRYIPFYIECRTCKGEDGLYYVIPEEKTLTYISDEYIRNNVRETASVSGKEYLNKDKDEFLY